MKPFMLITSAALSLSCVPVAAQSAYDPALAVDAELDRTARVARDIWEIAELGYLEEKSSGLLQSEIEAEGFTVETGVAGIPTAFIAEWGEGGPVIGVLAEFDALPGITQSDQPIHQACRARLRP